MCTLPLNRCGCLEVWWYNCSFSGLICSEVCVSAPGRSSWCGVSSDWTCAKPGSASSSASDRGCSGSCANSMGNTQLLEQGSCKSREGPYLITFYSVNTTVFKIINTNVSYFVSFLVSVTLLRQEARERKTSAYQCTANGKYLLN